MIDHKFEYTLTGSDGFAYCKCGQPADKHSRTEFTKHVETETIAEEAARIVYGDREQAYDDPSRNFKKLAHMWTGTLLELLKPGAAITPQLVALCLIQLKISRESFKPSRENRVDGVGYWLCEDRVVAEEGKNDVV